MTEDHRLVAKAGAPEPVAKKAVAGKAVARKAAAGEGIARKAVARTPATKQAPPPAVPAVEAAKAARPVKPAKVAKPPKAVKTVKTAKADKPAKARLVRDSFTIPKDEYEALASLKTRALGLQQPARKSELLRAGIRALAAMTDRAFLAAVKAVPTLKTGRPKSAD